MGQGSTRRGKPHCEAFPAVDILEVARSLRAGSRLCVWEDEHGRVVGEGRLLTLDADRMVLQYSFRGSANIAPANSVLEVYVSGTWRNPHVIRRNFDCPACQRHVQMLFYVSAGWACRICHNLVYLKQRLAVVNKKIHQRDQMVKKLADFSEGERHSREPHNQQRHIDQINRELAAAGCASLPEELLYRTSGRWLQPGEVAPATDLGFSAGGVLPEPYRGLAYFTTNELPVAPVVPCELIGSPVLDRPILPFLREHKATKFAELEEDIANGRVIGAENSYRNIETMLADRLTLQPLVITSDWSDMAERVNGDRRVEYTISARYEGEPTLWRIGPGTALAKAPLRAVLDAGVVTLQARVPKVGLSNPAADLRTAAMKLEARLLEAQAKLDEFNAVRPEEARRRTYYDLTHKRRPHGFKRMMWLK